jgi:hypothetical protein
VVPPLTPESSKMAEDHKPVPPKPAQGTISSRKTPTIKPCNLPAVEPHSILQNQSGSQPYRPNAPESGARGTKSNKPRLGAYINGPTEAQGTHGMNPRDSSIIDDVDHRNQLL